MLHSCCAQDIYHYSDIVLATEGHRAFNATSLEYVVIDDQSFVRLVNGRMSGIFHEFSMIHDFPKVKPVKSQTKPH